MLTYNRGYHDYVQYRKPCLRTIQDTMLTYNTGCHAYVQYRIPCLRTIQHTMLTYNKGYHAYVQYRIPCLKTIQDAMLTYNTGYHAYVQNIQFSSPYIMNSRVSGQCSHAIRVHNSSSRGPIITSSMSF